MTNHAAVAAAIALACCATPVFAQDDQEAELLFGRSDRGEEGSVFDDTWVGIGFGVRLDTSYDGSDDYIVYPLPAIAGEINGIGFSPRAAGFAIDLFDIDLSERVDIGGGPVGRLRQNRKSRIKDEVVAAAGKLGTAVEVGAHAGLTIRRVLHDYDRISIGTDVRWDVAGAHSGFVFDPGIAYRTPLSRGTILGLSVGAQYADSEFMDYYFSVSPEQSAASGLPLYQADSGWFKAGGAVAFAVDLDGDVENGGFIIGALAGYSRMLGDAADTPYTSMRGDADQFHVATGVGYIF